MNRKREWQFIWLPLLRRPFLTIIYVAILSFVTYMGVMHAVEFTILKNETSRLEDYYKPIGFLIDNEDVSIEKEDIDFIQDSEYFDFEDKRRLCAGVIEGVENTDWIGIYDAFRLSEYPGINNFDSYVYATLVDCFYDETDGIGKLKIVIDEIEVAYLGNATVGEKYSIQIHPEVTNNVEKIVSEMKIGSRYFLLYGHYYSADEETQQKLSPYMLLMKPLDAKNNIIYIETPSGESIDLSSDTFANIRNDIEILKENQSTMMFESTKDMRSIADFHDSARLYRVEIGRALTYDDYLNKNPVCVIPEALGNGLTIGDTIKVKLKNIYDSRYDIPYIIDEQKNSWKDYPTEYLELEIVGKYYLPIFPPPTITDRIYIPESVMPEGYDVSPENFILSRYGFVLDSPRNLELFVAENEDLLREKGLELSFVETNADSFLIAVDSILGSEFNKLIVFGVLIIPAFILSIFIYLRERRKEIAILRVLGNSKQKVKKHILLPMDILGGVAIVISGVLALLIALGESNKILTNIAKTHLTDYGIVYTNLVSIWQIAFILLLITIYFLFCFVGLSLSIRIPVLELLQGDTSRKRTRKENRLVEENDIEETNDYLGDFKENLNKLSRTPVIVEQISEETKHKRIRRNQVRYELRYIVRSRIRAILMVFLVILLMVAITGIEHAIQSDKKQIEDVYMSTTVLAEFRVENTRKPVYIDRALLTKVLNSGLLQDSFYIASLNAKYVYAINNGEKQYAAYSGNVYGISDGTYVSSSRGYQNAMNIGYIYKEPSEYMEIFNKYKESEDIPIIVPKEIFSELNLKIGDNLYFVDRMGNTYTCIVADGEYASEILTYVTYIEEISGDDTNYLLGDFIFETEKNYLIKDFKIEMENYLKERASNEDLLAHVEFIVYDGELVNAIEPLEENLRMLEIIKPIIIVVITLLIAVISMIMIVGRRTEIAILRVLGNSKGKLRLSLVLSQLFICILGLLVGVIIGIFLRNLVMGDILTSILLSMGLSISGSIIGTLVATIIFVGGTPLKLLQEKE